MVGLVLQKTAIAENAVRGDEGKQERSKGVEVHRLCEMSVEQGGYGSRCSAAWALKVKEFMDRT
jgi:hypothetical protein